MYEFKKRLRPGVEHRLSLKTTGTPVFKYRSETRMPFNPARKLIKDHPAIKPSLTRILRKLQIKFE